MPDAGWYDDGSGRERWFDGTGWLDRYRDDPEAAEGEAADGVLDAPLRVFTGNGSGGSMGLTVYPTFVEFEHNNYVVAVRRAKVGPVSYSKKQKSPYDGVAITPDIDFHCNNPQEVYEYLRGYIAGS